MKTAKRIMLTTDRGTLLSISNIAKKNYGEGKYEAESRFIELVKSADRKNLSKVINANSIEKFHVYEQLTNNRGEEVIKLTSQDCFGNNHSLIVVY